MEGFTRAARRAAMFTVAFGSTAFGVMMIWALVRPGVIAGVTTVEMVAVLGLFLLPVATLAAWFVDHRAIAEQPAVGEPEGIPAAESAPAREFIADPAPAPARAPGRHAHSQEHVVRHGVSVRRRARAVVGDHA